jgi:integrase
MVSAKVIGVIRKIDTKAGSKNVIIPRIYLSSPGSYARVKIPGIGSLEEYDWDVDKGKVRSPRDGGSLPAGNVKHYNELIDLALLNAKELIRKLIRSGSPTASSVAEAYRQQLRGDGIEPEPYKPKELSLGDLFDRKVDSMGDDQVRTVWRYRSIQKKLLQYGNPKASEVNAMYLNEYEHYLRSKLRNKANTVHSNMKVICSVLIEAAGMGHVDRNEIERYKLPKVDKTKKVPLTESELVRFWAYQAEPESLEWHVQRLFIFAVMAGGMRFEDVVSLTWRSVDGDQIAYRQAKTGKAVSSPVHGIMSEILEFYGQHRSDLDDPVFPFLSRAVLQADKSTLKRKISSANADVNKTLKKIAKGADVYPGLHTHMARHTFASIANNRGANLFGISKSLGHSSLRQTEVYINSFSSEVLLDPFNKLGEVLK